MSDYQGVVGFIEATLTLSRMSRARGHRMVGGGLEAFLYQHGRRWPYQPLPAAVKPGSRGECYRNAAMLVLRDCEFIYCEGLALGAVLPVQHAWCLDDAGRVIDPTWHGLKHDVEQLEYVGIAFQTEYLRDVLLDSKRWTGLIDGRLLGLPVRAWKHRFNRRGEPIRKPLRKACINTLTKGVP